MTYAQREKLGKELAQGQLIIHDLERLGIIAFQQEAKQPRLGGSDLNAAVSFLKKLQKVELLSIYSFTEYGLRFVSAVTPSGDVALRP